MLVHNQKILYSFSYSSHTLISSIFLGCNYFNFFDLILIYLYLYVTTKLNAFFLRRRTFRSLKIQKHQLRSRRKVMCVRFKFLPFFYFTSKLKQIKTFETPLLKNNTLSFNRIFNWINFSIKRETNSLIGLKIFKTASELRRPKKWLPKSKSHFLRRMRKWYKREPILSKKPKFLVAFKNSILNKKKFSAKRLAKNVLTQRCRKNDFSSFYQDDFKLLYLNRLFYFFKLKVKYKELKYRLRRSWMTFPKRWTVHKFKKPYTFLNNQRSMIKKTKAPLTFMYSKYKLYRKILRAFRKLSSKKRKVAYYHFRTFSTLKRSLQTLRTRRKKYRLWNRFKFIIFKKILSSTKPLSFIKTQIRPRPKKKIKTLRTLVYFKRKPLRSNRKKFFRLLTLTRRLNRRFWRGTWRLYRFRYKLRILFKVRYFFLQFTKRFRHFMKKRIKRRLRWRTNRRLIRRLHFRLKKQTKTPTKKYFKLTRRKFFIVRLLTIKHKRIKTTAKTYNLKLKKKLYSFKLKTFLLIHNHMKNFIGLQLFKHRKPARLCLFKKQKSTNRKRLYMFSHCWAPFYWNFHGFLYLTSILPISLLWDKKKKAYKLRKLKYTFGRLQDLPKHILRKYMHLRLRPRKINDFLDQGVAAKRVPPFFKSQYNIEQNNSMHPFFFSSNQIETAAYPYFDFSSFALSRFYFKVQNPVYKPKWTIFCLKLKRGYMRRWRAARRLLQIRLQTRFRYQHRLTRYLLTHKRIAHLQHATLLEMKLINVLMRSRLVLDKNTARLFINNDVVFLNGVRCSNASFNVCQNDFLQLIISFKYYITFRWLLNHSLKVKARIKKVSWQLKNAKKLQNPDKTYNKVQPAWVVPHTHLQSDIMKYMEVDFFTLSVFFLYDPFLWNDVNVYNETVHKPQIFNMYNWKYIT